MNCRFDGQPLSHVFVDLDYCPPSNSYLRPSELNQSEIYYPLKLFVSERTFLVQVDEYMRAENIFSEDYAYFSSYSKSWLSHAEQYVAQMCHRFAYGTESLVVELASNDGYLLQYFKACNIPVLGIEPSLSVATTAQAKDIETIVDFFGLALAERLRSERKRADLIVANNVLAHVPDLNDFVGGMKLLLAPEGVITVEFPHLMHLIEKIEFDTIYHEHYSYFSFYTVQIIFASHGLEIFDVEELKTHGGSLRIYAQHIDGMHAKSPAVEELLRTEHARGMREMAYYKGFQAKVDSIKFNLLSFLLQKKSEGKRVVAYGAAAKGNTLLNYCGIRKDLIEYVVDASTYKQGRFMPGSHIPIENESKIRETKPDYIIILPWNLRDEITQQLAYVASWDATFVTAIPELKCFKVPSWQHSKRIDDSSVPINRRLEDSRHRRTSVGECRLPAS